MGMKCTSCETEVDYLNQEQADVMVSAVDGNWVVDLILKCPHCGCKYNTFVPVEDFTVYPEDNNERYSI